MSESLSCSVLLNLSVFWQSYAEKPSTRFEPDGISKLLTREHNVCCRHGSSKCHKYLNTPDRIKEGLDERTCLEHVAQLIAQARVALLPFLFACQSHDQGSSSQTLEHSIWLWQFL